MISAWAAIRRAACPGVRKTRSLGFGCAIASVCDITIAGKGSTFALPEMGHNIMPTMAMSSLIDRLGRKAAMYLTCSTEEIDARTALAYRQGRETGGQAEALAARASRLPGFVNNCRRDKAADVVDFFMALLSLSLDQAPRA